MITYATRSASVYADARASNTTLTEADFPVRAFLEPLAAKYGLELADDYEGTSASPFMLQACEMILMTGAELTFFDNAMTFRNGDNSYQRIAKRFGMPERMMFQLETHLDDTVVSSLTMEDRAYYFATIYLAAASANTSKLMIAEVIRCCGKNMTMQNLFSGEKMLQIARLHNRMKANYNELGKEMDILVGLSAFSTRELGALLAIDADYALVASVRTGFETKSMDETLTIMDTTSHEFLKEMLG
jgi:hypothetical protein